MQLRKRISDFIKLLKMNYWHSMFFLSGLFFVGVGVSAPATDPLADSIKPQITALFGTGSTVSYAIYIGEIVLGAIGYIKSKNPMILLGVPIVVLFTHGMFDYISK